MTEAEQIVKLQMQELGQQARAASRVMAAAETKVKNAALLATMDVIDSTRADLAAANARDLKAGEEKGLDPAMLDRLELTDARIEAMIEGLRQVASL